MVGDPAPRALAVGRDLSPAARLRRLKGWTLATSVATFAAFLGLAGAHVTGVTSRTGAGAAAPDFGAQEHAFFGGDTGGQNGFEFGTGTGQGGASAPAASTTVS